MAIPPKREDEKVEEHHADLCSDGDEGQQGPRHLADLDPGYAHLNFQAFAPGGAGE